MKKKTSKEKPTEVIFVFEMHLPGRVYEYLKVYEKHGKPDIIALEGSQESLDKIRKKMKENIRVEPFASLLDKEDEILKGAKIVGVDPFTDLPTTEKEAKIFNKKLKHILNVKTIKDFWRYYQWMSKRDDQIFKNVKKLVMENPGKRIYIHMGEGHVSVYEEFGRYVRQENLPVKIKMVPIHKKIYSLVGYPPNVNFVLSPRLQLYRLIKYNKLEGLTEKEKKKVMRSYIREMKRMSRIPIISVVYYRKDNKLKVLVDSRLGKKWGLKSYKLLRKLRSRKKK